MTRMWTRDQAIELCRAIEDICPEFGCHVALTGGILYRSGDRKDADILFYRVRQVAQIDSEGLFKARAAIGVERVGRPGVSWVVKATWRGKPIDCFFPEVTIGDYPAAAPATDPPEEVAPC